MKRTKMVIICAAMSCVLGGCCVTEKMRSFSTLDLAGKLVKISENASGEKTGPDGFLVDPEPVMRAGDEFEAAWEEMNGCAGIAEPGRIDWNTEEYKYMPENGWMTPLSEPFSTFAADVDTASYANVRRMLLEGKQVPADAVRIEEMVNYFHYDYPRPGEGEDFSVSAKIAPCPWNEGTKLLRIGLKAREEKKDEKKPSNLVFLIDVSGSMDEYNKLPLVQRAFRLLIDELSGADTVSIVTYANEDTVVLNGVSGDEKTKICDAVEDLSPSGGTNGSQGIVRAYELAEENFIEGGINRVLLATDGDLNIGMTDEGSLTRLIEEKAKSGVFLSVLGFGEGNISDTNMEALADHGNGNYSYIDSISEARKVLFEEAGSTLTTVAKDVKLQVEFNPALVGSYRLIGYENRTMSAESFADDEKDGGELGSGHTVTALYELIPAGSGLNVEGPRPRYTRAETEKDDPGSSEWAVVGIRWKKTDGTASILREFAIDENAVADEMDDDMSWAAGVALTGMLLEGSEYAGTGSISEIRDRLAPIAGEDEFRQEFLYLLGRVRL